ncbi:Bro-N domain-containing protein [Comamonas sp.]|uniref:BRO-N domain-containing protein n=1 Tax=Comamonas sp. TaxID=34028 RepID=UPI003A9135BB
MADITPFNFGAHTVRVVTHNDQPWFVATDVANTLGYRSAPDASRHLDDDEKGTQIVRTPGGDQKLTIISESGLYALVLRSRKPEARKFAKWVTSEVLPSIRQTGGYNAPQTDIHLVGHAHQLAHAATLQVYQPVFDAVMLEGEAPHATRMLLSFTRGAGGAMTPYV